MVRALTITVALLAFSDQGDIAVGHTPILSIAYAGDMSGAPDAADLADIPLLGFSAVTWSGSSAPGQLNRLENVAASAGLRVVMPSARAAVVPLDLDRTAADLLWPTAWRAVAHGARVLSIVPPAGTRLRELAAANPTWLRVVGAIARQLHVNGALFGQATSRRSIRVSPPAKGLELSLLDAGRTWLLVATNTSTERVHATARLPENVPYAMWLDLLDGSTLAMLEQPDGPTWVFDLAAAGVRICVIDKRLK